MVIIHMIKGVGIDVIEISRIAGEIEKYGESFLNRVFTMEEINYSEAKMRSAQHYAVRFAAKEAVFKALGTGWQQGVAWKEVVVKNDVLGKPTVELLGRVNELAARIGANVVHLSLTHSREYAAAVAVLEG